MLRSTTLGIRILLLLAPLAGCAAAQGYAQVEQSCTQTLAIGNELLGQGNASSEVKGFALAQHIASNSECYSPELVAQARILIATPTSPNATLPPYLDPIYRLNETCPINAGPNWPGCNKN